MVNAGAPDASPQSLPELLSLCAQHARGRWGIWTAELDNRRVYVGRRLFHLNGQPFDRMMRRPITDAECCLRCGNGNSWNWPPRAPSAYTAVAWVTFCLPCLGLQLALWPEIFPRLRLGVRTYSHWDNRFRLFHTYNVSGADWYRRAPFANEEDIENNPWRGSRTPLHLPSP